MSTPVPELRERIAALGPRDARRLARRLDDRRRSTPLDDEVGAAEERLARRRASVPPLVYPEHLPVSAARAEIAATIAAHQVVVLAGETGSGKTTQLPKILLGLGRGVGGMVGHTQPRRIAARAVAERVAGELGTDLGDLVGYTVRFHDQVADSTLVKVMTDGILLAELRRDPDLLAYDTIVVDEAHERSLTIDFLLGYLTQLLPRRPDLKVVVTSATIDVQRLSEHFGGAPVLTVSGRTYPVEVRYRPPGPDDEQTDAVVAACRELVADGPGDVLVFLSGEREIRDTAEVVRGALPDVEVLPLFGRLSAAEQHAVFAPAGRRRVVLATNVAETSLTVPGIRYVVDTGLARISRYSLRTKVQRLPIERVSQASATQRSGRCGRVADGVCVRLYSAEDFEGRPAFTEPEILRTSLAAVLLAMAALGLGDVERFPFLEPPDPRAVRDGRAVLAELGALSDGRITRVGRDLAQLPVDPRLGRMLVEAGRRGCVAEVLVITSALSVQDPRERPIASQQQAAELHARFADPTSDLLAWLNLWRYVAEQQEALSSSAFRRLCKREMLSWLRIREWQDLYAQLRRAARRMQLDTTSSADPATVTTALLAGLLSQIGLRQEPRTPAGRQQVEYLGARGTHFVIAPGTPLARKPPALVVAAELVETSRLYARGVARIEPEWVEAVAGHLLARSYAEPRWEAERGSVVADERVTLYGVPIVARRTVSYGRIDPVASHDLFVRHALAEGDWRTHHAFWSHNQQVLGEVADLAARTRRPELTVSEETLHAFYEARVPAGVVSTAHFDRWWKSARRQTPALLDLSLEELVADAPEPGAHPTVWTSGDLDLPLDYAFDPGAETDGVTVEVPVEALPRMRAEDFGWQVPGLRHELVTALIRTLPKALRVPLVPAPDTATRLLAEVDPQSEALLPALSRAARRLTGTVVPVDAWDLGRVPAHLRPAYRVRDADGGVLGEGRDLAALQDRLAPRVRAAIASAAGDLEESGLTSWTVGDLPAEVVVGTAVGYPTLVDEGATVALRVLPTRAERTHRAGVRRLLLLAVPSPVKGATAGLSNAAKLTLTRSPHGSLAALLADATAAAVDVLVPAEIRTETAFAAARGTVRDGLVEELRRVLAAVQPVLAEAHAAGLAGLSAEGRAWQQQLVGPGFVTEMGAARLPDLARYLRAAQVRAERAARDPQRDASLAAQVREAEAARDELPAGEAREQVRWMVEELRVSLFAQSVGARGPVSIQRILRAVDAAL